MIQKKSMLRNIKLYEYINYLTAAVLIWSVTTLYYNAKGLSFFEISLLQSIGSVLTICLEIPSGWVSDRFGNTYVLRISAVSSFFAVLCLILFHDFKLLIISEAFFSIASAAKSGADTALFYDTLTQLDRRDDYKKILSRIRGRQSLIRIFARLLSPALFAVAKDIPFWISLGMYLIIVLLTAGYVMPARGDDKTEEKAEKKEKEDKKSTVKENLVRILIKYKRFIAYCVLSSLMIALVSNYSQYISPFLNGRGLDVKWLGIILALSSVGEYLGTKTTHYLSGKNQKNVLLVLGIAIAVFVCIGGITTTPIGGAVGYFGVNMIYSPFVILLSDALNSVIDDKYRATLLSVSNMLDEMFSVVVDPIIGIGIDALGFGKVYIWMSMIVIAAFSIIGILIKINVCKKQLKEA